MKTFFIKSVNLSIPPQLHNDTLMLQKVYKGIMKQFSPDFLKRLDLLYMMNRLNLGFYSHIGLNNHQHTHLKW